MFISAIHYNWFFFVWYEVEVKDFLPHTVSSCPTIEKNTFPHYSAE